MDGDVDFVSVSSSAHGMVLITNRLAESLPGHPSSLASPPKGVVPCSGDLAAEAVETIDVG